MLTKEHRELKQTLIEQLERLGEVAKQAGMHTLSKELLTERIPKVEGEQFSLVVLGEFNHGKSTFVNALLGSPVLPAGITPTTATINHLVYAKTPYAKAMLNDGRVVDVDPNALSEWVTVEGANNEQVRYVEVGWPAPLLADQVTLVDTPGVNDINEARAEITYQYIPQADLVLFLLDANQILKQSERNFLQQRLLRRSKDKLLFIIGKSDLLSKKEQEETLAYCRRNLGSFVEDPTIFPVSARLALSKQDTESGFPELLSYLRQYLSTERGRVLLDNAAAEGLRFSGYLRQNLGIKRRALDLTLDELEAKIVRIHKELYNKQKTLRQIQQTIDAEASAIKAKLTLDLEQFTKAFCEEVPRQIDKASAKDIELYLKGYLQDIMKSFTEEEGEEVASLLDRLIEQVIQVTNENLKETLLVVSAEMGVPSEQLLLNLDAIKYDVGLFALGALGTGIYIFVNTFVGGLLTLAAPLLGVLVKTWLSSRVKQQAKEQTPKLIEETMAALRPKFLSLVDEVANRLSDFVQAAGKSLYQGISEVLDQVLAERRTHGEEIKVRSSELDRQLEVLHEIELRLTEVQKKLWTSLNS